MQARWLPLQVTSKTCWTFVEIEDREGRVRVGDETPLFDELVGNALQPPESGTVQVPDRPGLGVRLAGNVVQRLGASA